MSALQNYDFIYKDLAQLDLQRDVCTAILIESADRTHDFVEAVTENAGFSMRIFHDQEAAIAGLDDDECGAGFGPAQRMELVIVRLN